MPTSKPWVSSGHFTQGADPPCICLEGASGVMPFGGCGFCYVFSHQALHAVPLSKHRSSQLYGAHYCHVMFLFTLPHMFLFWFKSCLQPCLDIGCLPNVSWLLSLSPVFLCSLWSTYSVSLCQLLPSLDLLFTFLVWSSSCYSRFCFCLPLFMLFAHRLILACFLIMLLDYVFVLFAVIK